MIEPTLIKRLKEYNNSPFQILSVYLGEDAMQSPSGEFLLTQFHSLVHQHLDKEQRSEFEDDINRIERYLKNHLPSTRGLAFFCAGKSLWETAGLEFFLPPTLNINNSPNISPLAESLHRYSRYLVLLVDREKARMFTVEQGEITDRSEFTGGYVPQNSKSTGRDGMINQTDTNFRHNELLLKRHIDLATQAVVTFTNVNDVHFLIVGGHAEIFKKVVESLPANLKAKLAGTMVTDVNLPLNDILLESKKIAATISEP